MSGPGRGSNGRPPPNHHPPKINTRVPPHGYHGSTYHSSTNSNPASPRDSRAPPRGPMSPKKRPLDSAHNPPEKRSRPLDGERPTLNGRSLEQAVRSPLSVHGDGIRQRSGQSTPTQIAAPAPAMTPTTATGPARHPVAKGFTSIGSLQTMMDKQSRELQVKRERTTAAPSNPRYDAELDALRKEISEIKREQTTAAPSNPRYDALRKEISEIKSQQTKLVDKHASDMDDLKRNFSVSMAELIQDKMAPLETQQQSLERQQQSLFHATNELKSKAGSDKAERSDDRQAVKDIREKVSQILKDQLAIRASQTEDTQSIKSMRAEIASMSRSLKDEGGLCSRMDRFEKQSVERLPSMQNRLDSVEREHRVLQQKISELPSVQLIQDKMAPLENIERRMDRFEKSIQNRLNSVEREHKVLQQKISELPSVQLPSIQKRLSSLEADQKAILHKTAHQETRKPSSGHAENFQPSSDIAPRLSLIEESLKTIQEKQQVSEELSKDFKEIGPRLSLVEESLKTIQEKQEVSEQDAKELSEDVRNFDERLDAVMDAVTVGMTAASTDLEKKIQEVSEETRKQNEENKKLCEENKLQSFKAVHEMSNGDVQRLRDHLKRVSDEFFQLKASLPDQFQVLHDRREIDMVALKSLEDRYQNISTEKLYKQMIHWLQQAYPGTPDLLNRIAVVQNEVAELRKHVFHFPNTVLPRLEKAEKSLAGVNEIIEMKGELKETWEYGPVMQQKILILEEAITDLNKHCGEPLELDFGAQDEDEDEQG